jgi:hypothetical protein
MSALVEQLPGAISLSSFLSNDFPVKNVLAQVACAFISLGSRYREIFDQMEHDTRKLEQLAGGCCWNSIFVVVYTRIRAERTFTLITL